MRNVDARSSCIHVSICKGVMMRSFAIFLLALVVSSFIIVGCGEQQQSSAQAQTAQKGKSPDGKDTGFAAQVPEK